MFAIDEEIIVKQTGRNVFMVQPRREGPMVRAKKIILLFAALAVSHCGGAVSENGESDNDGQNGSSQSPGPGIYLIGTVSDGDVLLQTTK